MASIRFAVNPKNFAQGVASARRLRGTFDAATKTWLLPANMAPFAGPQNPGLIRVEAPAAGSRCPYYTREQGCVLHGEACPGR